MPKKSTKTETRAAAVPSAPEQSTTSDDKPEVKKSGAARYFKTRVHGLRFVTDPGKGQVIEDVKYFRFTPYLEEYQGDMVKFGYAEVTDPKLAERIANDPNCQEINKSKYDDGTGKDATPTSY